MPKSLIIQLARFGDLLQTKRLAYSVCRDSETHLCIDASLEDLARLVYPAEAGFVLHPVRAHGQSTAAGVLAENAPAFRALAAERFDSVYNCNSSGMNAALAALFPPERVRGLRNVSGQPMRETWMRLAFRWTGERRLAPLNLADYWALFAPDPIAPEQVNPAAKPGGKGLGVVLAGRMARRSLPPEVLAPIVRVMASSLPGRTGPAPVFLLGSVAEKPLARELARLLPAGIEANLHDLTGKTDWVGLAEALRDLDAVISPDTGAMHLAAHLGVPVTAFFLSSAWVWETGPYGLGHRVLQAVQPCLPCVETQSCPNDIACLEPFRSPALLRWLSRREDGADPEISGLWLLHAGMDALGLRWDGVVPGDSQALARQRLRSLAAEYFGIDLSAALPASPSAAPLTSKDAAAFLFQERDWMLPPLPGTAFPSLYAPLKDTP